MSKLDAESMEDFGSDDGGAPMKRGGSERRSFLQRYRKMRKRDSRDPLGSNVDMTGEFGLSIMCKLLTATLQVNVACVTLKDKSFLAFK